MEGFSNEDAHMFGLWLQLFFTAIYLTYSPRCVMVLWRDYRERSSLAWLALTYLAIFVCTITDQAIALVRAYQVLKVGSDSRLPNPDAFYGDVSLRLTVTENWANVLVPILADLIIIYRTYIIWDLNLYVVALPICLLVVDCVFGAFSLIGLFHLGEIAVNPIFSTDMVRYYYLLTLCLNITCSSLICWKIWRIRSAVFRSSSLAREFSESSRIGHVHEVVIQSASLYCAYLLALTLTAFEIIPRETNLLFLFLDPFPPVAALLFSMLMV